jgi:hypothetical protein
MGYGGPAMWRCPFCGGGGGLPLEQRKVSTGGWIVFVVLLLCCFPLCFIGLTMKRTTTRCRQCGTILSGGG